MSKAWPMTPLGEILTERKGVPSAYDIENGNVRIVAKIGFNDGKIVLREDCQTKTGMILIFPGDLVISGINAAKGAIAVYGEENTDPIAATIHYGAYIPNNDRVDIKYLWRILRSHTFRDLLMEYVPGGIKTELKAKRLLPIPIPLPPLSEQRHIVARIEGLAAKVEEARRLRQQAIEEAEALFHSKVQYILTNGKNKRWEFGTISNYAEINPSKSGKINFPPLTSVSFVPMSAVDDIAGCIIKATIRPFAEVSKGYTWFKNGDIIFARITPCMQNGKTALAEGLTNGIGFGSTEFHVLRPSPKVMGRWLHILMRHKDFRKDAAMHFKGTAGQQRVPQSFLEQKVIPVPPISEQRSIVAYLDKLQAKVDALKRLQTETTAELDALLPSILDKAFKVDKSPVSKDGKIMKIKDYVES